jgi:hypothetical protein
MQLNNGVTYPRYICNVMIKVRIPDGCKASATSRNYYEQPLVKYDGTLKQLIAQNGWL